jgi:succinate dehydrogenase / fumarate reductase, cytochrome b subunit
VAGLCLSRFKSRLGSGGTNDGFWAATADYGLSSTALLTSSEPRGAMNQALTFIDTTIGKKIVMAISGLVLFGFVIGHMAGNLQIFLGPETFNAYASELHEMAGGKLLWGARSILLAAVALHIIMAMQLVVRSAAARPIGYKVKKNERTTFAALTMKWSGLTLLLFVLFHLAHFTFPGVAMGAYEHQPYSQAYTNLINGFSIPWVVALYNCAMISLGLHLYHGSYSLFQTLGMSNPRRNETVKGIAQFLAMLVTVGNLIIPLSVLFGIVQ